MKERLSKHIYGENHPLIGMPCLYRGRPAIPYGCHSPAADCHGDGGPLLTILFFDPESSFEGGDVHVKAMSGIKPDNPDFVVLHPEDQRYKRTYHTILSWLADNRCSTYECQQRHAKKT